MSIPSRLSSYLNERGARYDICALSHDHFHELMLGARHGHFSGDPAR